ncbi:hypothetical protein BVG18_12905 [Acinetobacter lwoffii]|nr:hypothetical protein BVG18_12905 [Acinetobacter lwoffii]
MMTRTLDGVKFDMPPTAGQVMELAHLHRKKLDDAICSKSTHLGDYGLAQRKEVYDFTRALDVNQREQFYKLYNGELVRIADEDRLHPPEAEAGLSKFAIALVLLVVALVLYSTIITRIMN